MVNVLVNSLGKIYTDSTGKALSVSGGGSATLITKTITENGTYNASSDSADGYSSVTVNVSGGTPSGTTDVPLTRVSDDNGNEIGTWYMNFKDGSGNVFKVILLDAQYRKDRTEWCSNQSAVTNMPLYGKILTANIWEAPETATENTQLILDYCTANGYTSAACSHCRSQSFTIDNVIYYGQLPNMIEVAHIAKHYSEFDTLDTSISTHASMRLLYDDRFIWSSHQYSAGYAWDLRDSGAISDYYKTGTLFTAPVLEIPII